MRPRPRFGLPALRAAELVDMAYVSLTGTTPNAVIRQARRVVRSATLIWGDKVRYPPGVVVYLGPSASAHVQAVLHEMGADGIAGEIAKRLRDEAGQHPRLTVWIKSDLNMSHDFDVAVLERPDTIGARQATAPKFEQPEVSVLIASVLHEWEALAERVPPDGDRLMWLEQATGVPFRRLDAVRRVRNRVAHGKPVERDRLTAALATIREVDRLFPAS